MGSNQQTELTSKIETDLMMESRMTAKLGRRLGVEGLEKKGKRTHGHGQQWGDCGGDTVRGLSGNGKKYNKN